MCHLLTFIDMCNLLHSIQSYRLVFRLSLLKVQLNRSFRFFFFSLFLVLICGIYIGKKIKAFTVQENRFGDCRHTINTFNLGSLNKMGLLSGGFFTALSDFFTLIFSMKVTLDDI